MKKLVIIIILITSQNCLAQRIVKSIWENKVDLKLGLSESTSSSEGVIAGPSYGLCYAMMKNKSMDLFVETYNSANAASLQTEMTPLHGLYGKKYGLMFGYNTDENRAIMFYFGQQVFNGSLEAKYTNGQIRKIDYTQKSPFDLTFYVPIAKFLNLGFKIASTSQIMDAYTLYEGVKVYDDKINCLSGIYRTNVSTATTGIELNGKISIKRWIYILPGITYQSTYGKSSSNYFNSPDWARGLNSFTPNNYEFPSDYNAYLLGISNYTILPEEANLKPRNRMIYGSVSVVLNIGRFIK